MGQLFGDSFEPSHVVEFPATPSLEADTVDAASATWASAADLEGSGGPTVGGLSTPTASVLGQSLNPVAGKSPSELLTDAETRSLLGQYGFAELGDDWLRGPDRVSTASLSFVGSSDTSCETFAGVTGSSDDPSVVYAHVATVENGDDVVLAASVEGWGVSDTDRSYVGDDGYQRERDLEDSVGDALEALEEFEHG